MTYASRADTIYQKNGEVIKGAIIDSQFTWLKIKIAPHKTWLIYRSNISRIGLYKNSVMSEGTKKTLFEIIIFVIAAGALYLSNCGMK
jgi:hypothetical protein